MKERIKELRNSLKLSQKEFSQRINIGYSTLAMLELGKRNIKDIHISQICSEFNVREEWLRYGTGEMFVQDQWDEFSSIHGLHDLEKMFLKAYMRIDKDLRQQILEQFMQNYSDIEQASAVEDEKVRKLREYERELDSEKNIRTSSASRIDGADEGSA